MLLSMSSADAMGSWFGWYSGIDPVVEQTLNQAAQRTAKDVASDVITKGTTLAKDACSYLWNKVPSGQPVATNAQAVATRAQVIKDYVGVVATENLEKGKAIAQNMANVTCNLIRPVVNMVVSKTQAAIAAHPTAAKVTAAVVTVPVVAAICAKTALKYAAYKHDCAIRKEVRDICELSARLTIVQDALKSKQTLKGEFLLNDCFDSYSYFMNLHGKKIDAIFNSINASAFLKKLDAFNQLVYAIRTRYVPYKNTNLEDSELIKNLNDTCVSLTIEIAGLISQFRAKLSVPSLTQVAKDVDVSAKVATPVAHGVSKAIGVAQAVAPYVKPAIIGGVAAAGAFGAYKAYKTGAARDFANAVVKEVKNYKHVNWSDLAKQTYRQGARGWNALSNSMSDKCTKASIALFGAAKVTERALNGIADAAAAATHAEAVSTAADNVVNGVSGVASSNVVSEELAELSTVVVEAIDASTAASTAESNW